MDVERWGACTNSFQPPILGFGLLQDGDVGVGVFPEVEELLIPLFRFSGVARKCVSTPDLKMSQCSGHRILHDTAVIQYLLKLYDRCGTVVGQEQSLAADICWVTAVRLKLEQNQLVNVSS
jgi:hypothetical protein